MRKFLAFAAVYLIWGSTYLAIGVGVRDIPPFLMAGVRFFTAGAILFGFARRGEAPLTRREWAEAALAGLLFFTAAHGLGHWAQVRIPSGAAAVLVATVVFWITGLDAAFVARKRPSPVAVLCAVTGFSGRLRAGRPLALRGRSRSRRRSRHAGRPRRLGDRESLVAPAHHAAVSAPVRRSPDAGGRRRAAGARDRVGAVESGRARGCRGGGFRGAPLSRGLRLHRRLRGLHLAPVARGAGARRHLRLREPADRGPARRPHPG